MNDVVSITLPAGVSGDRHVLSVDNSPVESLAPSLAVGPRGLPGPPGSDVITRSAGAAISALRAVSALPGGEVQLTDPADASSVERFEGITVTASASGADISIKKAGVVNDPSLATFTSGTRLFVGPGGFLTSTPPTSGASLCVGVSLGGGDILIRPAEPVFLE